MSKTKRARELGAELLKALRDHRHMIRTLHKIEEALDAAEGGKAPSGWSARLARLLTDLRAEIEPHFAAEERLDGFFDELRTSFPRFARRLDRLEAEHPRIIEAVSAAAGGAVELAPGDAAGASEVARAVRLAIATLRRHESEENELIQRAYCRMEGAGD